MLHTYVFIHAWLNLRANSNSPHYAEMCLYDSMCIHMSVFMKHFGAKPACFKKAVKTK